jgi:hypothetical protein
MWCGGDERGPGRFARTSPMGSKCNVAKQRRRACSVRPAPVRYLDDSRLAIDTGEAERAIRPLAIGRLNWLDGGGDGGFKAASVLLSVCATATRHRLNP